MALVASAHMGLKNLKTLNNKLDRYPKLSLEIWLGQIYSLHPEKSGSENFTQNWLTRCQTLYNISFTQILREINFVVSGSAKSAILTHSVALNFLNFMSIFTFRRLKYTKYYTSLRTHSVLV